MPIIWKKKYIDVLRLDRKRAEKWFPSICFFCKKSHKRTPDEIRELGWWIFCRSSLLREHFCPILLNVKTPNFIKNLAKNFPSRKVSGRTLKMKRYDKS